MANKKKRIGFKHYDNDKYELSETKTVVESSEEEIELTEEQLRDIFNNKSSARIKLEGQINEIKQTILSEDFKEMPDTIKLECIEALCMSVELAAELDTKTQLLNK